MYMEYMPTLGWWLGGLHIWQSQTGRLGYHPRMLSHGPRCCPTWPRMRPVARLPWLQRCFVMKRKAEKGGQKPSDAIEQSVVWWKFKLCKAFLLLLLNLESGLFTVQHAAPRGVSTKSPLNLLSHDRSGCVFEKGDLSEDPPNFGF